MPIVEIKVCNFDGEELPRGQEGVLWIRGVSVAQAYFGDESLTSTFLKMAGLTPGMWFQLTQMVI